MAASDDRAIRERLVHQGVGSLSDVELIAVLIQDGGTGISAAELAQNVFDKYDGSLSQLSATDMKTLRMTAGLGLKRAAILAAALELGRRIALEDVVIPCAITSNTDVEKIFRSHIAALPYEEFWVLYLSSANTVVGKECVSRGGISETVVDHRLVLKRAIETLASGIILVHNHPSGVAKPSDDDLNLTRKIVAAAELLDISVLDHLIITSGECYSFRGGGDL